MGTQVSLGMAWLLRSLDVDLGAPIAIIGLLAGHSVGACVGNPEPTKGWKQWKTDAMRGISVIAHLEHVNKCKTSGADSAPACEDAAQVGVEIRERALASPCQASRIHRSCCQPGLWVAGGLPASVPASTASRYPATSTP